MILRGEKKNHGWPNATKMMNNPKQFIQGVQDFDGDNIDDWKLEMLKPLLAQDWFTFDVMKGKSQAAAFLCSWVVNIVAYNKIFKKVKPLKEASDQAQAEADAKQADLAIVKEKVRLINEKVDQLKQQLQDAEDTKRRVEEEAQNLKD
mmetsp:Transcript_20735/g.31889  ORF Transcript_20735/g.31889 Transcript_20735/m.31889 type:complete len:148 (+) Transcript_20735:9657-10100(+)